MLRSNFSNTAGMDPSTKLRLTLQEGRRNTSAMIKKLETFECQLNGIEEDLRPLQEGTQKYTIAKENISKTLAECGKTYEYFRIAADVKHIANAPYSREKEREIFDAMDRLSNAKTFFEKHREMRSSGTMLDGVNNMLKALEDKCVGEFKLQCKNLGSCVKIVQSSSSSSRNDNSNNSTVASESGEVDHYEVIDPLSEIQLSEIQKITNTLDSLSLSKHLDAYRIMRLNVIHNILTEHKTKNVDNWNKLYNDDFPFHIRNNNPLGQYMEYVLQILRGEMQLWGVLFHSNPLSVAVFLEICHTAINELHNLMKPLLDDNIYNIKNANNSDIVHPNNIFLIRMDFLDCFMTNYHAIYEVCKPDFRKDSSASLALIEMRNVLVNACIDGTVELLRSSKDTGPILDPHIDDDINALTKINSKIGNGLNSLGETMGIESGVQTAIFTISNAGEKCDLLPLTNDTLHCCEQLLQFGKFFINKLNGLARDIGRDLPLEAKTHSSLIYSLLQNLKSNYEERGDYIVAAIKAMIVAHSGTSDGFLGGIGNALDTTTTFVIDGAETVVDGALSVMDSLNPMNMFSSASAAKLDRDMNTHALYDSGAKEAELSIMSGCQHLFFTNNYHKLYEFLNKNRTLLYQCVSAKLLDTLISDVQDKISSSRTAFCNTIARVVGMMAAESIHFDERYKSTKDKTSSGRLIKAKFSTFNSGLEALLAQQGAWRISSGLLRDELGKQLADTIIPTYSKFYDTYSKVNFSKRHIDQYVRFTADDANLILGRFFGGGK